MMSYKPKRSWCNPKPLASPTRTAAQLLARTIGTWLPSIALRRAADVARRPGFQVARSSSSSIADPGAFNVQPPKSNIDAFTAEGFIEFGELNLRALGVTRQKAHYCVQVAHAFTNGDLKKIARLSDEEAHAALLRIKGVGPWTANIYLLMALKRPDIWPDGDIALASAAGRLQKMNARPSFVQLARIAERWRPYRSVAARMLWQYYLAEQNRR